MIFGNHRRGFQSSGQTPTCLKNKVKDYMSKCKCFFNGYYKNSFNVYNFIKKFIKFVLYNEL